MATLPAAPVSSPPRPAGTVVAGRYQIESVLGQGGMGDVYLVRHTVMRKRLALKLLRPEISHVAEFAARFSRAIDQILDQGLREPEALRAVLFECGHPYDYARLGHPLSTVYELYMQGRSGAAWRDALAGLLTRDARVKERKKAGLKKARKAPQYSKR